MAQKYLLPVLVVLIALGARLSADETVSSEKPKIETAATVNDRVISYDAFVEGLIERHGKAYLEELILDTLLQEHFERHEIKAETEEVDEEIRRDVEEELLALDRRARETEGRELKDFLAEQGKTVLEFRKSLIKNREKSRDAFRKQVKSQKLVTYFLLGRERVSVRYIRFDTEREAKALLQQINAPDAKETFVQACDRIMGPAIQPGPGHLAPFAREDYKLQVARPLLHHLDKEFSVVAFSLKKGDHSEAFQTRAGWFVVSVIKRFPAREGSYKRLETEVKKAIRTGNRPQQTDYNTWIGLAQIASKIERTPALLKMFEVKIIDSK